MPAADLNLVFGASGYIGGHLVPWLLARGMRVRTTSRNPEVLYAREWDGPEIDRGDALDPESLDRVLAGVDTA
ncbi:MAG: NAD(P)H-binding protein, partial [Pseudomonadota bacterium]